MEDFFETEAGRFIALSHNYFSAARFIRYTDRGNFVGPPLLPSTLHLVAHGLELLLKYPHLRAGLSQAEVRRKFGHDLLALWQSEVSASVRANAVLEGMRAWERARASGQYPGDDFADNPVTTLDQAVVDLSQLHSGPEYALRYGAPGPYRGPRAAYLIDAFGYVAERIVANPRFLD